MSMKYVAAYALASLTNPSPSAGDLEAICKSVGIETDKDSLDFVVQAIAGRDVATLIAEGAAKMSAAAVSASPEAGGAAAPTAAAAGAPAAAKKEEEEEEDDDMGFGLFD